MRATSYRFDMQTHEGAATTSGQLVVGLHVATDDWPRGEDFHMDKTNTINFLKKSQTLSHFTLSTTLYFQTSQKIKRALHLVQIEGQIGQFPAPTFPLQFLLDQAPHLSTLLVPFHKLFLIRRIGERKYIPIIF